jgi:hypothetical protein
MVNRVEGILIATSSSDTRRDDTDEASTSYSITLGTRTEQNPYTAKLAAIVWALTGIPPWTRNREVTILSSSRSALAAIGQPHQQSGQSMTQEIYDLYDLVSLLQEGGNWIGLIVCEPEQGIFCAKPTIVRLAMDRQQQEKVLPERVGRYSKTINTALPGRHTRTQYDGLERKEAIVLAQLRTGMTRLNSYLSNTGAAESDLCICGQASETVEHFLFRCTKWVTQREGML